MIIIIIILLCVGWKKMKQTQQTNIAVLFVPKTKNYTHKNTALCVFFINFFAVSKNQNPTKMKKQKCNCLKKCMECNLLFSTLYNKKI